MYMYMINCTLLNLRVKLKMHRSDIVADSIVFTAVGWFPEQSVNRGEGNTNYAIYKTQRSNLFIASFIRMCSTYHNGHVI